MTDTPSLSNNYCQNPRKTRPICIGGLRVLPLDEQVSRELGLSDSDLVELCITDKTLLVKKVETNGAC